MMHSQSSTAFCRSLSTDKPSMLRALMRIEREIFFSSSNCSLVLLRSSWALVRPNCRNIQNVKNIFYLRNFVPNQFLRYTFIYVSVSSFIVAKMTTHVIAPFLDSEVRSGLARFFHGLEHGLAFLFGLLEPLPFFFDVTLFLFFNLTNPPFFFFLLLLSETFLFLSAGYLYI